MSFLFSQNVLAPNCSRKLTADADTLDNDTIDEFHPGWAPFSKHRKKINSLIFVYQVIMKNAIEHDTCAKKLTT